MLNKNQSKRRNYWKYYAVIPALVAFVLLFQIEVVAKERQPNTKVVSTEIESVDVYKILKNSTDAELKEIKEKLKKLHNINFEVSQIKRNSENELTSIKVDIINGSDKSQSIQTGGDKTIKDFGIIVITDKNGKKKAGIQTSDEKITVSKKVSMDGKTNKNSERKTITTNTESNVNTNSITSTKTNSDTNTNISTTVIINKDNNTKVITTGTSTAVAVSNGTKTNIKISSPLVIVDGEEMPAGFDYNSIKPTDIESVNVLTGVNATGQYGNKASNGVIEIETKK